MFSMRDVCGCSFWNGEPDNSVGIGSAIKSCSRYKITNLKFVCEKIRLISPKRIRVKKIKDYKKIL